MALNLQRKAPCGRAWREGNSTSHGPSLQATQGEVQWRQEARPRPTSCTGFLEGQDKEEEGATWKGGGCSQKDTWVANLPSTLE